MSSTIFILIIFIVIFYKKIQLCNQDDFLLFYISNFITSITVLNLIVKSFLLFNFINNFNKN